MERRGFGFGQVEFGHCAVEQRRAILGADFRAEGGIDPVHPLVESTLLGGRDRDRVACRVVVRVGDRIARRLARLFGPDRADVVAVGGRDDVPRGGLTGRQLQSRRQRDVDPEDRGETERKDRGRDAEARAVATREGTGCVRPPGQHLGQPPCSTAAASAAATFCDTTLPSARPRVRGASQPMTLPRSRRVAEPVAAMPSATS
jgi:hypothetical protein